MTTGSTGAKRGGLLALNALAIAAIAWMAWGSGRGAEGPTPGPEDRAASPAAGPTLEGRGAEKAAEARASGVGSELRYRTVLDSSLRMRTAPMQDPAGGRGTQVMEVDMTYTLRGTLVVRVLAEEKGDRVVSLRMPDASFRVEGVGDAAGQDTVPWEAALRAEAIARIDATGRVREVILPVRDVLGAPWRDLISLWEVVVPTGAGADWETEGADATGTFVARYRRTTEAGGGPIRLDREKLRYVAVQGSTAAGPADTTVSGVTRILHDGHPLTIEGREQMTLATPKHMGFRAEGERSFLLDLVSVGQAPDAAAASPTAMDRLKGGEAISLADPYARYQPAPLSPEQAAEALRALVAELEKNLLETPADGRRAYEDAAKLELLLRSHPTAVAGLMARLRELASAERITPPLIGVLAGAGTPEAQAGLAEIAGGNAWKVEARRQALSATVEVGVPEPALEEAIRAATQAEDPTVRSTAYLALATAGSRLRRAAPERASRIEKEILALGQGELTPGGKIDWFGALGNLSLQVVPEAVPAALEADEDEGVRRAAIYALRGTGGAEVERTLLSVIEEDTSEEVRQQALEALVERFRSGTGTAQLTMARLRDLCLAVGRSATDEGNRTLAASLLASLGG